MTDDILCTHARAIALRGKLIGVGFDPLTVAYNPTRGEYVIVLPLDGSKPLLDLWLMVEGFEQYGVRIDDDTVAITVSEAEAQP